MGRCWSGGKLARRALTEVDAQRRRCRDRCRARTRPRGRVSPWRVIQLCVVIVQERRSKQFRPPLRGFGELLLLCSCKEEVTKKKARPGANRPAAPAGPLRFSARWGRPTTRFAQTRGPPFSHPACDARFALRVGTAMATATATAARGAWIGLASRRIRARAALDKHCALAAAAVHDRCRDLIGGSYLRERPLRGFAWLGIQGHGERVATGHIRNPAVGQLRRTRVAYAGCACPDCGCGTRFAAPLLRADRSRGLEAAKDVVPRVSGASGTWMCRGREYGHGRPSER